VIMGFTSFTYIVILVYIDHLSAYMFWIPA
jgi:hypothetical protein